MDLYNKYFIWYNKIIDNALERPLKKERGFEIHHIIPKSCGGNDNDSNLVKLTLREHYISHALLVRFLDGKPLKNMRHALNVICNTKGNFNSHIYEENRLARIDILIGGKHSAATIKKMKIACKNRPENYSELMSSYTKGINKSEEHKRKLSEAGKKEKKFKCIFCDRMFKAGTLKRWHNDNCKYNPNYIRPYNSNGRAGLKHTKATKEKISTTKRNKND